jgi:hypothetical protein
MNYTTPDFSGANFTIGIFDPVNSLTEPGTAAPKTAPGFHVKAAWKGEMGGAKLSLSATGITQEQKYNFTTAGGLATSGSYQSTGGDVFGKVDFGGLSLMASGYYGRGMGITGLYLLADDGLGDARDSYGYLLQATYTIDQLKIGVNYGVSRLSFANSTDRALDFAAAASGAGAPLVADNNKITGGVYYNLTKNLTLLGEISWAQTFAHFDAGLNTNQSVGGNFGVFMAF